MVDFSQNLRRGAPTARASAVETVERSGAAAAPAGLAAHLYCERRRRDAWFGDGLFWDPAWDLLLYLYDACEAGRAAVPIGRALQASAAVSEASARRWIDLLAAHGYVAETTEPDEARSTRIGITPRGCEIMTGFLRESRLPSEMP